MNMPVDIGLVSTSSFSAEWAMIFVLLLIYLYSKERGKIHLSPNGSFILFIYYTCGFYILLNTYTFNKYKKQCVISKTTTLLFYFLFF